MNNQTNDPGKHYRPYVMRVAVTEEDVARGYVEVSVDPYRISALYKLGGGPREHIAKKCLRGEGKGHTEDEVIEEIQATLNRWRAMRAEDKAVHQAVNGRREECVHPEPPPRHNVAARVADWCANGDTGISSKAMLAAALGNTPEDNSPPYDAGDFGRCYKLVEAVPEVMESKQRIAELSPAWAYIMDNWQDMARVYRVSLDCAAPVPVRDHSRTVLRQHLQRAIKHGVWPVIVDEIEKLERGE